MNTPVSFEIAKLLKEKGLIFKTSMFYPDLSWKQDTLCNSLYMEGVDYCQELSLKSWGDIFPAPTITEVVMWLYEKHSIWIAVTIISHESWQCYMTKIGESLGLNYNINSNSPTEAYSQAIIYTLKNLI